MRFARAAGVRWPRGGRRLLPAAPVAVAGLLTVTALSACAVGPDPGPGLVPAGAGGGQAATSSSTAPPPVPDLTVPKTDLAWKDCGPATATTYRVAVPQGVKLECAQYDSPANPDKPDGDALTVHVTRATTAKTPTSAPPLVLTSGTDLPSSRTLVLMAAGAGRSLVDRHPVVAVDRRGIPQSSAVDCLTRDDRATITDNGLAGPPGLSQRIARLAKAGSSAADGCTETLTPNQLAFGLRPAASDLETLRKRWGVEHLGLIGIGEGSDVALAYTTYYGGRSGRLVLDTPTPFGANASDTASARATGVQAALRTFTQRCAGQGGCSLGPGGEKTIADLLAKARTPGPGTPSDTETLAAITTGLALASRNPDALGQVASAITAADAGDPKALSALATTAAHLRLTDGQIVSRCNDVTGPVGQNEIGGLIDTWGKQNPLTASDSALSLMRCNGWASTAPTSAPESFPVDPLVLNNTGDPINGGTGAARLKPMFDKAGARPATVAWDGLGYSALAGSSCAVDVVADYVDHAPLDGPSERGCPA